VVEELAIGLDSWIIQDGNYDDFEVGQQYDFALEFFAEAWAEPGPRAKALTAVAAATYSFAGEVVVKEPKLTILDVGVLCYSENKAPSPLLRPGDWVGGRMYLGVDPFFWFETHAKRSDLPRLRYRWRVERIQLETTPWVDKMEGNTPVRTRQAGPQSFVDVAKTDAWRDDNGHGHYVLRCRAVGLAP
jgi:hypothetical protein